MATYYMRSDGTAANKAAATGPSSNATACMNVTVHNGETFSAGDEIILSEKGGPFIDAAFQLPSSGALGNRITYRAEVGGRVTCVDAADSVPSLVFDSAVAGGDRYKRVLGWGVTPIFCWTCNDTTDTHLFRQRAASLATCTALNQWWYESGTDTFYIVVATGTTPNDGGLIIRAGRRTNTFKASNGKSHIAVRGLNFRFSNTTATTEGSISHQSATLAAENWLIDDCTVQWGPAGIQNKCNTGTPWAAAYYIEITNTEVKNCHSHGLALSFFTGALLNNVNVHDCGRQGGGLLLRDSLVTRVRFNRCGNASNLWPGQSATVQAFDSGLYLVGQPSPLFAAYNNIVEFCEATGNAKCGLSTDAASDLNLFHHNLCYSNTLFGIFFEGGTENGSYGNKAYHNTCWNNGKSGLHATNGIGNIDCRNNLLFGNGTDGSQDMFLRHDISGTWSLHSGSIYKRLQVRWTPSVVATTAGTPLTQVGSVGAMSAGTWFFDDAADTLYVWKTDGTAVTIAYCTPATADIIDYNCYTPAGQLPGGTQIARFDDPTIGSVSYTDLATMVAATSYEDHGVQVDPLYVNAAGVDFHLRAESTCIGIGALIKGVNY